MTPDERNRTAAWAAAVLCLPDNRDDVSKHENIDHACFDAENNSFKRRGEGKCRLTVRN